MLVSYKVQKEWHQGEFIAVGGTYADAFVVVATKEGSFIKLTLDDVSLKLHLPEHLKEKSHG